MLYWNHQLSPYKGVETKAVDSNKVVSVENAYEIVVRTNDNLMVFSASEARELLTFLSIVDANNVG